MTDNYPDYQSDEPDIPAAQFIEHDEHESSDEDRIEKMAMMTIGAAKEIVPKSQVMIPLMQIANGTLAPPEIRQLAHVLLKIINGERDIIIATDLPLHLVEVIEDTLHRIEAPLPTAEDDEDAGEGLTLIELLERVGEACTGNVVLWQQLWKFMEALTTDPHTPPDIQQLGHALKKILAGERQPHVVDNLSPKLAGPVNQLLQALLAQSTTSH